MTFFLGGGGEFLFQLNSKLDEMLVIFRNYQCVVSIFYTKTLVLDKFK